MSANPFNLETTPVDMLAQTQKLYRWSAEELIRIINAITDGSSTDGKGAIHAMRELRAALYLAIDESQNVEKTGKTLAAAAGNGAGYDLDAARDEVGRRLARLRAARDSA